VKPTRAIHQTKPTAKTHQVAEVALEKEPIPPNFVWQSLAFAHGGIQTKLKISEPGDAYELQADRIADHVMRTTDQPAMSNACDEEELQRQTHDAQPVASPMAGPIVQQALSTPGRPLDRDTQTFFEQHFGRDLSHVQIHTGSQADASAAALNARAYTLRDHLVFRSGYYSPESYSGRKLIAHELVHVLQQAGAGVEHVQRDPPDNQPATASPLSPAAIEELRQHAINLSREDETDLANRFPNGFHLTGQTVYILSMGGGRASGYQVRAVRVAPQSPLQPAVETYFFNVGKARSIMVNSTAAGGPSVLLDVGGGGQRGGAGLVQALEQIVGSRLASAPERLILSHTDSDHFNAARNFLASSTFSTTSVEIATEQLRSAVGQRDWTRMGITLSPGQQLIEIQVTATSATGAAVHVNRRVYGGFTLTEFRSVAAHQALMTPGRSTYDKNRTSPVTVMVDNMTGERTLFTADGTGHLFNEVVNAVGEEGFTRLLGGSGGLLRTVEYPHHGGTVSGAPDVSGVLRMLRLAFEASDGRVNLITQTSARFAGLPGASIGFLDLAGVPVERVLEPTAPAGVSEARRIRGTVNERVQFDMTGLRNVLALAQTHETQIQQAYQRLHELRTLQEQARTMQQTLAMSGAPNALAESAAQTRTELANSETSLRTAANRVWAEMETASNAAGGMRAAANLTGVNTQLANLAAEVTRVEPTRARNDLEAHEANLNAYGRLCATMLRMYSALQGERYEELNQLQSRYRESIREAAGMLGPAEVDAHVRSSWAATRAEWTPERLQEVGRNLGSMAAARRTMLREFRVDLLESLSRQIQLNQLAESAAHSGRQVYRADGTAVTPFSTRMGAGVMAAIEVIRIALELAVQLREANQAMEQQASRDRVQGVATVFWWTEQGATPTLALVKRHWFTGRRQVVSGSMSQEGIFQVARGRPPANTPEHDMVVVTDVPDRDLLYLIASLYLHVYTLEDWHRVNGRNPSGETFRKFGNDWGVRLWSEEDHSYLWKIKSVLRDPLEALHRNLEAGQRESLRRIESEAGGRASTIRDTAWVFGQDRRAWVYTSGGSLQELDFEGVQPRLIRWGETFAGGETMLIMQAVDLQTYQRLSQYYWKESAGEYISEGGGGTYYRVYRNLRGFALVRRDDVVEAPRPATSPAAVQRKAVVSQANDPYEREADSVADHVMRMSAAENSSMAIKTIQRKCIHCDEEEEKLQRKEDGQSAPAVPPLVHEALSSPGESLDATTRSFMEERFEHEFGDVRVHTDATAAASARAVNALAYTVGRDIVFGTDLYQPGTQTGNRLLAHELTHTVQQQGKDVGMLQRDPPPFNLTFVDVEPVSVARSGSETTLSLNGVSISHSHRVHLRVDEPSLQGRQAFAWQFVPGDFTPHSAPTLRIVAAPGVAIRLEGWPTTWIAGREHPGLEIYRVQDPALVPPQGEAIIPTRYVNERQAGSSSQRPFFSMPQFVVRSTTSSVDITHTETNVSVHIELRLSGADRFAYELIESDFLSGRRAAEIRVVKTASTPLVVRAGAGVLPVQVRVWVVDQLSQVPPQGRPVGLVGRELMSIPAEVQLTLEQQAACAIIPMAISMIPIVGEIYMIADFTYGAVTGRDPICRQRRDELGHMMAGMGALFAAVSLGARGLSLLSRATGRTPEAVNALINAVHDLSAGERATLDRLQRLVREGQTLNAADTEALAQILRQLQSHAGQLGGLELRGVLNAERSGFLEPELQQVYQRYLAHAGPTPLAPEAWVRTGEGEAAFRNVFGTSPPAEASTRPQLQVLSGERPAWQRPEPRGQLRGIRGGRQPEPPPTPVQPAQPIPVELEQTEAVGQQIAAGAEPRGPVASTRPPRRPPGSTPPEPPRPVTETTRGTTPTEVGVVRPPSSTPPVRPTNVRPVNGTINVGGGLEADSELMTNLNPIVERTGGAAHGIPNHIRGSFEEIDQIFEHGSVRRILSHRLTIDMVDWSRAAEGSFNVLEPGGHVDLNIWTYSQSEVDMLIETFRNAGFHNVRNDSGYVGAGTRIMAFR
jgi:hypothetical protein